VLRLEKNVAASPKADQRASADARGLWHSINCPSLRLTAVRMGESMDLAAGPHSCLRDTLILYWPLTAALGIDEAPGDRLGLTP
jgi:hypothetical protein